MAREQAATRRLVRRVGQAEAGRPLVDLLAAWVPAVTGLEVARARVRALIAAGAVHVDGVPRRSPSLGLRTGARVDVLLRLEALRSAPSRSDRPFTLSAAQVLYEDDWLTAIDKPPGIPTHATLDPRRPSLVGALQEKLAAAGRGRYVAVHQRLDRDTSGVVLFATDPAANDGLARAFAGRQVEKTYVALALPAGAAAVPTAGAKLTVDVPLAVSEDGRVRAEVAARSRPRPRSSCARRCRACCSSRHTRRAGASTRCACTSRTPACRSPAIRSTAWTGPAAGRPG